MLTKSDIVQVSNGMQQAHGNIWSLSSKDDAIVIPVNVGWRQRDNRAVMGRGLAFQASQRWPWLRDRWGQHCRQRGADAIPCVFYIESKWARSVILFPSKPLNEEKPWLSWYGPSDLGLIKKHLPALSGLATDPITIKGQPILCGERILVPLIGCGNGNLDPVDIVPVLEQGLTHERFVLVHPETRTEEESEGSEDGADRLP